MRNITKQIICSIFLTFTKAFTQKKKKKETKTFEQNCLFHFSLRSNRYPQGISSQAGRSLKDTVTFPTGLQGL